MKSSRVIAAMTLLPAVALSAGGCSLIFGTPDQEGFSLHNESDVELDIQFSDGHPQLTFSPGSSSKVGIRRECDTLALEARHNGREYASITDERLCDASTNVYIRGENDMVIEDR